MSSVIVTQLHRNTNIKTFYIHSRYRDKILYSILEKSK